MAGSFRAGDLIEDLLEFQLSSDGKFVAARTHIGWVNVWRLNTGRRGRRPKGMFFIDVLSMPREPAIAG